MKTIYRKSDDYIAPETVYDIFHRSAYCAILDSSLQGENGRFSIIGLHPYYILKEENGIAYGNDLPLARSFEEELADYLREHEEKNDTRLPLLSGGIGYFSYDYGCKFEQIPISNPKRISMPEAMFCFYDNFIIFDLFKREMYLTAKGILTDAAASLDMMEKQIHSEHQTPTLPNHVHSEISFDFSKDEYIAAVNRIIEHIVNGDIYIANLTQQMQVCSNLLPYDLFRIMRKENPAPFGGYFHYDCFEIVSASPECFLSLRNRQIETKPIKGTRKRGTTAKEDDFYRCELENSEKDHSELLMIIDLERNDLNRICETDSVKVSRLFDIEAFATVFHLVSTIRGTMRAECTYADLLMALFPGGSITGAPKIEAMKIIDRVEHSARGLYTGSFGYISFDGSCDLNIVIRTALWQNHTYHIGIGGGITCESDPEAEYEETLQKAKAFYDIFKGDVSDGRNL